MGAEVVLSVPILDAMIRLAEPGGSRVNRPWEMLFIVVKHYLERSHGLLLVARQDPNRHARFQRLRRIFVTMLPA
ncbi:hypothetical protein NKDENANG_02047 [Candidatus Entotheonellaceae bacterium PAL068K]